MKGSITDTAPFNVTHTLPHTLLTQLQSKKDTARSAVLVAKVPGHPQEQLMQPLIVCIDKTHLSH